MISVDELADANLWRHRHAAAMNRIAGLERDADNAWRQYREIGEVAADAEEAYAALEVLRFWEALGYVGLVCDRETSIRFYQEQAEIALESR